MSVGLIWVAYRAPGQKAARYADAGIAALLGALIGGRTVYVAVNWGYYLEHLVEIPEVWLGGLSGIGALAGAVLALAMLSVFVDERLGSLADALLPLAATLSVSAWMGCWMDGCAYGSLSDGFWAMRARDEWEMLLPRIPVQVIGALLAVVLFWAIERASERLTFPGQAAGLALLGVSLELFALSFLRGDPTPHWRGMRLDAWGALIMAGVSSLYLAYTLVRAWNTDRKRRRRAMSAEAYEGS